MTSDSFDHASDMEEFHRQNSIKAIRETKPVKFSGFCLSCNQRIDQGRFCSMECNEDYELEQNLKAIKGIK